MAKNQKKANKLQTPKKLLPSPKKILKKILKKKKKKNKLNGAVENLTTITKMEYPIIRLHREIEEFYQEAKPTQLDHSIRCNVIDRLTALVHNHWPYAKVVPFGSFCTGLYLPTADIDLVIFGRWEFLPLKTFEYILMQSSFPQPYSIQVIDKASVPIVKVVDQQTGIKVDICFNNIGGVPSADFLNEHIQKYPAVPRLALVLKQFLRQRSLGEVYHGGLSSFSLVLMVISLVQMSPLGAAANYGVLLMEFLALYGLHFNYSQVGIDVCGKGGYFPRPNTQHPLHIQDPVRGKEHNVGRSSHGAMTVKDAFAHAYVQLSLILNSQDGLTPNQRILDKIAKLPDSDYLFRASLDHICNR